MFSGPTGPDGKPRVTSTVCPVRVLDPDAEALVAWFLEVLDVDGFSGVARGVREWPDPGGVLDQDARTVEAVNLLLAEFGVLTESRRAPKSETPAPAARGRKRKG